MVHMNASEESLFDVKSVIIGVYEEEVRRIREVAGDADCSKLVAIGHQSNWSGTSAGADDFDADEVIEDPGCVFETDDFHLLTEFDLDSTNPSVFMRMENTHHDGYIIYDFLVVNDPLLDNDFAVRGQVVTPYDGHNFITVRDGIHYAAVCDPQDPESLRWYKGSTETDSQALHDAVAEAPFSDFEDELQQWQMDFPATVKVCADDWGKMTPATALAIQHNLVALSRGEKPVSTFTEILDRV